MLLCLLAVGFYLHDIGRDGLWIDEGESVMIAELSLPQIQPQPDLEIHPPGYFYLLHFWVLGAGDREFAVRFLSLMAATLLIATAFRIARDLFGCPVGLAAAAVVTISPFNLAYAQEARMYSLVQLAAGLSVLFFLRMRRQPSVGSWLLFAVVSIATPYLHYFASFVDVFELVALAVMLVAKRASRRFALAWTTAKLVAVGLFLPQVPRLIQQAQQHLSGALTVPSPLDMIRIMATAFVSGVVTSRGYPPSAGRLALLLLASACVGASVWMLAAHADRALLTERLWRLGFVASWAAVPTLTLLGLIEIRAFFDPRHDSVAALPLYLLLAAGGYGLWTVLRPAGLAVALLLLANGMRFDHAYFTDAHYRKDDDRGVAQFVAANTRRESAVVLSDAWVQGINYYLRGDPPSLYLHNPNQSQRLVPAAVQGRREVFFVHWFDGHGDPQRWIPFELNRWGVRTGEYQFWRWDLESFDIPAGAPAPAAPRFQPAHIEFQNGLTLVRYAFGVDRQPWAVMTWQVAQPPPEEIKAYLYLLDGKGHAVAQADEELIDGSGYYAPRWKPGETSSTYHPVIIPNSLLPGRYILRAGLYLASNGHKLKIISGHGSTDESVDLGSVALR
ncbi:MAG: glycosyltransferase family 39 protein [Chloroflexota bacterium]